MQSRPIIELLICILVLCNLHRYPLIAWLWSAIELLVGSRVAQHQELLLLLVEEGVCLFSVDEQVRLAEASLGFGSLFGLAVIRHGFCGSGRRRAGERSMSGRWGNHCFLYLSAGALSLLSLVVVSLCSSVQGKGCLGTYVLLRVVTATSLSAEWFLTS
ncbi:hypothetical protein KCU64_g7, partial [Aureobasidium melanogenum]